MFVPTFNINQPGVLPHSITPGQWVTNGAGVKGRFVGVTPAGSVWVCWSTDIHQWRITRHNLLKLLSRHEQRAIRNAHRLIGHAQATHELTRPTNTPWFRTALATLIPWAATTALFVAPLLG